MARTEDRFLVRESKDTTVAGEVWAVKTGETIYGIAGADGNAEKERKAAEDARKAAETARASAESARASAESARADAEQKRAQAQNRNDAQQEENNQRMQILYPQILTSGQYDPTTYIPTIGKGLVGKKYLVPLVPPVIAMDLTEKQMLAVEAGNAYVEWMWIEVEGIGQWEKQGVSQVEVSPISTTDIDHVLNDAGTDGTSEDVLTLGGFKYLWTRLKSTFAPLTHRHTKAQVDGLESDLSGIRDSLSHIVLSEKCRKVVFLSEEKNNQLWFGRADNNYALMLPTQKDGKIVLYREEADGTQTALRTL